MVTHKQNLSLADACSDPARWPVMICLLGNFRLLQAGSLVPVRAGGKREALLLALALQARRRVSRERLVQTLWPEAEPALALNSLNNLIHMLNKALSPALAGAAPLLYEDGYYRLNGEAGIGVDVMCFDLLIDTGDELTRAHDRSAAIQLFSRAVELYRADLCQASDAQAVVERERLRARYLAVLSQLADHAFQAGDYTASLGYLWRLLNRDPCREDAHRLVMRCYVRRGERAAAIRHYQICVDLLRAELAIDPEPATVALLEQIRAEPDQI